MNIDDATLETDLENGLFRQRLEEELIAGFRQILAAGARLPVASHYAAQIAEIVNREAKLSEETRFYLYQEVLLACEQARAAVLGEVELPS